MYKRNVLKLFILGIICLICLIGLQYFWYKRSLNLKDQELNRLTHIALRQTAADLGELYDHTLNETDLVKRLSYNYYVVNLNSQINPNDLEFMLSKNLEKMAIQSDYEYAIYDCTTDRMMYGDYISSDHSEDPKIEDTERELPTYDEFIYYFGVQFPNRRADILGQLGPQYLVSTIFLLLLGFIIYSLYIILYQKRFLDLQRDFINSITHEFKTPITSLTLAGKLIHQNPTAQKDEKLQRYGDIILSQAEQLNHHVNNILKLSTIERNELLLQKEDCNLASITDEIISSFSQRIEDKKGSISYTSPETELFISADKQHLINVIVNLIDNAIKYCDTTPKINVYLSTAPKQICIQDNGIGIDDVDQKSIFKKFYRSKNTQTQKRNGFGLGLYYVKNICDLHDWKISLRSTKNKGSTFCITF